MTFFAKESLLLLLLIPILIIILLFMRKKSEDSEYPFVKIFSSKSTRKNSFRSFLAKILRILLFVSTLISLIFSLSGINLVSDKVEHLIIYVDYTPLMKLSESDINAFIDSLRGDEGYRQIHLYINNEKIKYPVPDGAIPDPALIEKETVARRTADLIFSLRSNSVKSVIISDRQFERFNLETDLIVKRSIPKVLIVQVAPAVLLYSSVKMPVEIKFKDKTGRTSKIIAKAEPGFNRVYPPEKKFLAVSCLYDSVILEKEISISEKRVNDRTENEFVKKLLKALEIKDDRNSEIGISFDMDIEKGIVFSLKNEKECKKNTLLSDDRNLDISVDELNRNLEYSSLYEIPGKPLIFTANGEKVLSKEGDLYFVALPLDTLKSNFVFTPSFVFLMNKMLEEMYDGGSSNSDADLKYRRELTEPYYDRLSDYSPPKERDISFVFILLSVILLMILIFT
ncbi:MAG: BatA domain-containing protein [bacterium]